MTDNKKIMVLTSTFPKNDKDEVPSFVKDQIVNLSKEYKFLDFMNGKIDEINNRIPNENDLSTHLSTIFTENRLKKYIELRSMDTCGWDCLCAGPAFYVGILYGNLEEVYELISKWDKDKNE